MPSGLATRARIVLLAAAGKPNAVIARIADVSRPTVISWRHRYEQGGIRALDDDDSIQADQAELIRLQGDKRPPPEAAAAAHQRSEGA